MLVIGLATSLSLDFVGMIDQALGLVNKFWVLAVVILGVPMGFMLLAWVLHELARVIPR